MNVIGDMDAIPSSMQKNFKISLIDYVVMWLICNSRTLLPHALLVDLIGRSAFKRILVVIGFPRGQNGYTFRLRETISIIQQDYTHFEGF